MPKNWHFIQNVSNCYVSYIILCFLIFFFNIVSIFLEIMVRIVIPSEELKNYFVLTGEKNNKIIKWKCNINEYWKIMKHLKRMEHLKQSYKWISRNRSKIAAKRCYKNVYPAPMCNVWRRIQRHIIFPHIEGCIILMLLYMIILQFSSKLWRYSRMPSAKWIFFGPFSNKKIYGTCCHMHRISRPAPSDSSFYFSKKFLQGRRFFEDVEVEAAVGQYIASKLDTDFFRRGIKKLPPDG